MTPDAESTLGIALSEARADAFRQAVDAQECALAFNAIDRVAAAVARALELERTPE